VTRTESERAIDLAYRAVARRDLTVAELRARLEQKHVPPEAIDDAVAELQETGFLDDARYARQFAEDKREINQWGTDRIAMDLRRRGIAPLPAGAPRRPRARPRLADARAPRVLPGPLLRRDPDLGTRRARTPPRGLVADPCLGS
jgi:regulatory protein